MNVKQAVAAARDYFQDVFADEGGQRATLEEVWFEETSGRWFVTFGLLRRPTGSILDPAGLLASTTLKVVELNDRTGEIVSVKVRKVEPA